MSYNKEMRTLKPTILTFGGHKLIVSPKLPNQFTARRNQDRDDSGVDYLLNTCANSDLDLCKVEFKPEEIEA